MLTELAKKNKVVGMKQTLKTINNDQTNLVFIADDTDPKIKTKLLELSKYHNISVQMVESKLTLGRACGIDVSAACAAILK